jgi:aminoglycoside 6'-N-acetyltransferase I
LAALDPLEHTPLYLIKQANIDSFEPALELVARFFREEGFDTPAEELHSNLLRLLSSPTCAVFLAWRDSKAVGIATVTTSAGLEYGLSAEMEDLYVLPSERCAGIARALIEEVITWCKAKGVSALLVTVTPEGDKKHNLHDFYQRLGFANHGRVILERYLLKKN